MQLVPYLSFNGNCEAAYALYVKALGGQLGPMFRYAGSPMADQVPADWQQKIMHGSMTVGGQTLMGADAVPGQYETPKGFSLALNINSPAEAERVFGALAEGGTVVMPLAKTFWAERFGMVVDRFGIPWAINGGEAEKVGEA